MTAVFASGRSSARATAITWRPATICRCKAASATEKASSWCFPVYRQHVPHASREERRRNLVGFVEAVFQFDVMAETIMAGVKSPLDILMYDATAGPGAMPVYVRGSDTEKNRTVPKAEATSTPGTG